MPRAVALLCISMTLAVSACAPTPAPVVVQQAVSRCPRPDMPELPAVDPEEHVCSPANLDRLLSRADLQCWMISQQAAALDCYEAQAKGGKP
uniref:Lipoprotein n=1 Tax=Desulfovibrio sp. U5L TaxID=596152 RepID=I2Q2N9_9BACT